jgi:hypothetical protein
MLSIYCLKTLPSKHVGLRFFQKQEYYSNITDAFSFYTTLFVGKVVFILLFSVFSYAIITNNQILNGL